jgi:hypothetical protein
VHAETLREVREVGGLAGAVHVLDQTVEHGALSGRKVGHDA